MLVGLSVGLSSGVAAVPQRTPSAPTSTAPSTSSETTGVLPESSQASSALHHASSTHGAAGAGDRYFPLDGNGGIDVIHYDIRNRYDFDSGVLQGRTVLTLRATQDLTRFNLDLLLRPTAVKVDGKRARFRKDGKHELVIRPAKKLRRGAKVKVVVRHVGRPAKLSYRGQKGWFSSRKEVVAVNQPHIAPWWFAANDHPSDKATFTVQVSVPKGKEVISGGRLLSRRTQGARTVWRWGARDPMATYLAYFVAGDFKIARGRTKGLPWLVAVSENLDPYSQRASMKQLKKSATYVRWLEKHLGRYPFETTGGVAVGLDLDFALENQTRPVYPGFWYNDPELVVHELAHQWVGDSVSIMRWRDIWLNEGLATFMEMRWAEAAGGRRAQSVVEALWRDEPAGSSFWKVMPGRPGAHHIFDDAVYDRGGAAVQALRTRVGEAAFRTILTTWTSRHAGGHGTSADFEALAQQVSGQDLSSFFTAWLRTPSRPAHTVANGFLPR